MNTTPTLAAVAATLCPLPPEGEQCAPRGSDASSRRGAPQRGDRRPMRVVTRGRLLPRRFSSQIKEGRGPAALIGSRSFSLRDRRVLQRHPIVISATHHRGEPVFIVEVPADRAPNSRRERFAGCPAKLVENARRVDRIAA